MLACIFGYACHCASYLLGGVPRLNHKSCGTRSICSLKTTNHNSSVAQSTMTAFALTLFCLSVFVSVFTVGVRPCRPRSRQERCPAVLNSTAPLSKSKPDPEKGNFFLLFPVHDDPEKGAFFRFDPEKGAFFRTRVIRFPSSHFGVVFRPCSQGPEMCSPWAPLRRGRASLLCSA